MYPGSTPGLIGVVLCWPNLGHCRLPLNAAGMVGRDGLRKSYALTRLRPCLIDLLRGVFQLARYAQTPPSGCSDRRTTPSGVAVMDKPPIYSTQGGWQQGSTVATLPGGTPIYVCETSEVGFFNAKQRWLRIWSRDASGWIYGPSVLGTIQRNSPPEVSLVKHPFAEGTKGLPLPADPLNDRLVSADGVGNVWEERFRLFQEPISSRAQCAHAPIRSSACSLPSRVSGFHQECGHRPFGRWQHAGGLSVRVPKRILLAGRVGESSGLGQ